MKSLVQVLGYFGFMLVLYIVTTLTVVWLLGIGGLAVVPGVYLATGVLTIITSIIAATMSYHNLDIARDVEKKRLDQEHEYHMKVLKMAKEEENRGLAEPDSEVHVLMERPFHSSTGSSPFDGHYT